MHKKPMTFCFYYKVDILVRVIGLLTAWQIGIRIRQAIICIRWRIVANYGQILRQKLANIWAKMFHFKEVMSI